MNLPTIAAISDERVSIYSYKHKRYGMVATVPQTSLLDLVDLANSYEISTFWVLPGSHISQLAAGGTADITVLDELGVRASSNRDGSTNFLHMWKTAGSFQERRTIKVAFPQWDPRWGEWNQISDTGILLRSVLYLQDALEIELDWSPGHTSQALIKKLNTGQREQWLRGADLPQEMKDVKNFAKDIPGA